MRVLLYASILVFAHVQWGAATDEQNVRVRATQPTVVDVHEPRQAPRKSKVKQRVRAGAMQAAKGGVRLAGWLLNTDDDVAADKDRKKESSARKTKLR